MSENEMKPMTRQEIEKQIINKAMSDKDFKEILVNNPKEAFGRLGFQVPAEVEIKVVEESPQVLYLVLPVNPAGLTDEQLEGVTGGWELPGGWCLCHRGWDTNCWLLHRA